MSLMWLVLYPEIFQLKIEIVQCVMSLLAFDLCQTGFWHFGMLIEHVIGNRLVMGSMTRDWWSIPSDSQNFSLGLAESGLTLNINFSFQACHK